jgi:Iap family predicted aminopeptidase
MRRALTAALLFVWPLAQTPPSASIAHTVVADGHVVEYARGLTAFGSRLTGTASYQRAVEWAAAQFRDAGIERVWLDPFAIPDGWQRERASGRIVSPENRGVDIAALAWTPSTPDGGVEAEVVAVTDLAPDRIAVMNTLRGRIVLLPSGDVGGNPATVTARRRALDAALDRAGALAILSPESEEGDTLAARDRTFGAALSVLPAAQITRGDAEWIRRLLARGPVRIALELKNQVRRGPIMVNNVVAEVRGREPTDGWLLVGAHLDSWDVSHSAQDNAAGVAMILEAARAIAALPRKPRRSIRFVLWGGEEQGQLGSNAYARAHASELDDCVAVLNADAGTGRQIGWTAPGRPDVARAVRLLVAPFAAATGDMAIDESMRYAFQSDGAAFVRAGVPTLDLNADDSRYEEIHHKATDTLERMDDTQLAAGAALVAATAHAVADATARIGVRVHR